MPLWVWIFGSLFVVGLVFGLTIIAAASFADDRAEQHDREERIRRRYRELEGFDNGGY